MQRERLAALKNHEHDASARDAFASQLELARPAELVSTTECAIKHRKLPGPAGGSVPWTPDLTPYVVGIQDACDIPQVRVVGVKGPARSGKTVAAENLCAKNWIYGPSQDVLWYMQSRDDLNDYVDERVEWMLENHEQINVQIDWSYRRNSRSTKFIGDSLARWLAATKSTTRGKAAPIIVADEIDGYTKLVRRSILTRLINRQREFGTGALAYICSHPDEGPQEGIDAVLRQCVTHLWWWQCQACGFYSSPSPEAKHRMAWNVPELIQRFADLPNKEAIDAIGEHARLVCPHCENEVADTNDYRKSERFDMNATGVWLQEHQEIEPDDTIVGTPRVADYMGFTIHGLMSPFNTISGLAREWAAAKMESTLTGIDTELKEVVVKSLGETFNNTPEEKQMEDWQTVKNRLREPYLRGEVPPGVRFLTAFVDIQGDRFEVRIIGWNENKESWLIDYYAIKQPPPDPDTGRPAFENVDPANRPSDWDVLEDGVLRQTYPLVENPALHLPIARMAIDTGGESGVTENARAFASRVITRKKDPVPQWRLLLTKGASSKTYQPIYGKPKQHAFDDEGKALPGAVWERVVNVHEIKSLIAMRMKLDGSQPGAMHLPQDVKDRMVLELTAEQLVNEAWVAIRARNETFDGWVACEVARETLDPAQRDDNLKINWDKPPIWAKPFEKGKERGIDNTTRSRSGYWDRLRKFNRGSS